MLRKVRRSLFGLTNKERLPRIPSALKLEYEPTELSHDVVRVMNKTGARDVRGVELLLKRYGAQSVDDIIHLLPYHQPSANLRARLLRIARHAFGQTQHESTTQLFINRLRREGRLNEDRTRIYAPRRNIWKEES